MRFIPLLVLATACSGGEDTGDITVDVADYTLHLIPHTPSNQTPFANLDALVLVVEPAAGEPTSYTLSSAESGSSPKITDLPALDGATLSLEGYRDDVMVSFGRSEVIDLETGDLDVDILVANVNAFAGLTPLVDSLFGAAAAPDGLGNFYVFGGTAGAYTGGGATDEILKFRLAPPSDGLAFESAGSLPELTTGSAGRMGHTATLLTGLTDYQGKILIVGGTSRGVSSKDASGDALIWDPATEEVTETFELKKPIFSHLAVEDAGGGVVLFSGFGTTTGSGLLWDPSIQYFSPTNGDVSRVTGTPKGPLVWAAAASLGTDGSIACGGIDLVFSDAGEFQGYTASTACDRVTTGGELATAGAMDEPLFFSAMAPLGNGKALLTGGLNPGADTFAEGDIVSATDEAWIYESGAFRAIDPMKHPRAEHRAVALPDGRVLILGGVTTSDTSDPSGDNAMACAEIFDPTTETFTELETCDPTDDDASLPSQVALPAIAADPEYGVLVVGGLDSSNRSSTLSTLLVPCPDDEKC